MKRRMCAGLVVFCVLCAGGCVQETSLPTITTYTCVARDQQLLTILNATQPALPTVVQLPSGERMYVSDNHLAYHYDGPVCQ